MLYFGCIRDKGHYLWESEWKKLWMEVPDDFPRVWTFKEPWGAERLGPRESKIAPNSFGVQGTAMIQHVDGWTCVSFPDRSIDSRPNCVSAFMEKGTLSFEEMMDIAKREFTNVVSRYTFEVTLAKP